MNRIRLTALLIVLTLLSGCARLRKVGPAAPTPPPPEMVSVPPPTHPSEPEPTPEVTPEPPAPEPTPAPPHKTSSPRHRSAPAPAEPVTAAPVTPPPIDLGELTTGGESNSATVRQQTETLLATQQRRLLSVSGPVAQAHRQQMNQARMFLRQAADAWKKQDVEGARTLATKVKVLLDEVLG